MKAPNIHFGIKSGQSANQIRTAVPNVIPPDWISAAEPNAALDVLNCRRPSKRDKADVEPSPDCSQPLIDRVHQWPV
jgi:hypothetical protein